MYIIQDKASKSYFFGWDESGNPVFYRKTRFSKRYIDKSEANRDIQWISYMSKEYKRKSLKIVEL